MKKHISNIKIKNLFNEKDVDWNLKPVNILVGKNGLGKSTILRLIESVITHNNPEDLNLCDEITVKLDNEKTYSGRKDKSNNSEILKKLIDNILNSEEKNMSIEKSFNSYVDSKDVPPELFKNILKHIQKSMISNLNEESITVDKNTSIIESISGYRFESSAKKIEIEFISTVNMSANSVNNIVKSTGERTILLDDEIKDELERLARNNNDNLSMKLCEKLITALNNFFKETGKTISIEKESIVVTLSNGKNLKYQSLSSGERQIIFIFLKVINGSVSNSLILMDEPEISLHLSWQEKLLKEITKVNKSSQIIIVTHSPAIVMDGWFDCLTDINSIFNKNVDLNKES